jgi:predicted AlkP superfamily phosphohydrolase/phosphomutase
VLRERFFKPLDKAVGTLLDSAQTYLEADTLYLLVSDHGFQSNNKNASLNLWLAQHGYLTPARQPWYSWKNWRDIIRRLDRFELRKKLFNQKKAHELTRSLYAGAIDFEHSQAYAFSSSWGCIYLTASKRDMVERLINQLLEWKDPDTKCPVAKAVYRREEIYTGPQREKLPHLIVEPNSGYTFSSHVHFKSENLIRSIEPDKNFHVGTHHIDGIFVVSGTDIQTSDAHESVHLVDMAPTLLYWLGLPIPTYMDGDILRKWFVCSLGEPQYMDFSEYKATSSDASLSESEQAEIEKRLKMLGYM